MDIKREDIERLIKDISGTIGLKNSETLTKNFDDYEKVGEKDRKKVVRYYYILLALPALVVLLFIAVGILQKAYLITKLILAAALILFYSAMIYGEIELDTRAMLKQAATKIAIEEKEQDEVLIVGTPRFYQDETLIAAGKDVNQAINFRKLTRKNLSPESYEIFMGLTEDELYENYMKPVYNYQEKIVGFIILVD